MSLSRLLTYKDVAELLGLSVIAVKELRRSGALPYVRISERVIRFREQDVMQFIEDRHVEV